MIGPTDHEWTPYLTQRVGRIRLGRTRGNPAYELMRRFFDYWLRGIDGGFSTSPRVRTFVLGANVWRESNEWPLAGTQLTNYYLHSAGRSNGLEGDGRLDLERPGEELPDRYVYDPLNPVAGSLDVNLFRLAEGLKDRSPLERRQDVLVYTSALVEADLEITGPISVTLFAASSAKDTDFTAALADVFPDGYAQLIQEGIVRASLRTSDRERSLIEPGQVYEYHLDLCATSWIFRRGHRLRVEISSSNFNQYDRNLNTGGNLGTTAEAVAAAQTIYHDARCPSHITLPVLPR